MNTEILVHIAAPSTVHHDKRYRAIAECVLGFRAANLVRVTEDDVDCMQPNNVAQRNPSTPVNAVLDPVAASTFCQPVTRSPTEKAAEFGITRKRKCELGADYASLRESRVLDTFKYTDDQANCDIVQSRKLIDTIQKRKFRDGTSKVVDRPHHTTKECPVLDRPRTAPASITTAPQILVPCTERSIRRRALSESFSSGNNGVPIPYSQASLRETMNSNTFEDRVLGPDNVHAAAEDHSNLPTGVEEAFYFGQMDTSDEQCKLILDERSQDQSSDMSRGLEYPCFFLQDQSLDQTSQLRCSQSTSSVSVEITTPTATPSQQENMTLDVPTVNRTDTEACAQPLPINLISESSFLASQQSQNTLSSSQNSQGSTILNSQHGQATDTAQWLHDLEWKIDSPTVTSPESQFLTDITPRLREYDKCRPVKDHFLPVKVTRDVRVLERGFWEIPIMIADWSEVEEWRRLNTILRDGPVTSKYQHSPWTAEEFIAFYNRVGEGIKSGHLGSVRLFRVEDYVEPIRAVVGTVQVTLRLYSWGELIGHIYMAMRWLSESKIEYVPAKWVGSDGIAVVTMSGDRYQQRLPRLGQWSRKGGRGELGKYGLAEEEN